MLPIFRRRCDVGAVVSLGQPVRVDSNRTPTVVDGKCLGLYSGCIRAPVQIRSAFFFSIDSVLVIFGFLDPPNVRTSVALSLLDTRSDCLRSGQTCRYITDDFLRATPSALLEFRASHGLHA